MASANGDRQNTTAAVPVGMASSSHRHDDGDDVGIAAATAAGAAHLRQQQRGRREQREQRQNGGGGVIGVPGRILSTLQRKFWDSNKVRWGQTTCLFHF